ncbi:MarR family winged helix-turn-helix transcriptional regulator [Nocardia sp. alder85J]|uniref:MarR family winged helix-turn-helix transcriptional regulator n=1 Tax=Nocardia sp. alder85J TaxID=2862949 RepID=UPI001CD7A791|nr:MarR family transcriptional regulator [Nocardia sp. alder85J]MCX4099068.1 MarR family transcriptional regulator [Nocardia sp. alder85J]
MTEAGEPEAYRAVEHELGVLFRRARGLSAEVAREVHPELEPAAYGLLIALRDCARSRPSDLADHFGVGKATISRQVKVLEQLGLIERRADPEDGRAHLLVLTEEGHRRVEATRIARQQRFHAMLRTWSVEDVRMLGAMLARFNDLAESRTDRP